MSEPSWLTLLILMDGGFRWRHSGVHSLAHVPVLQVTCTPAHTGCCSCTFVGGTIWERITRHKLPVVEPGDSALFPQAAEDFKTKLADPTASGAVFFAVCRCELAVQHDPAPAGCLCLVQLLTSCCGLPQPE